MPNVLVNSDHCTDMVNLGKEVGALLLALEHRFYGPSQPFHDYKTEHLKYLSTEQALGDLSEFVTYINESRGLKSTNKWVTWGGSYPGMMAALARYRYPHLIHASVSSSAPLQPSLEMKYYDVVASALAATSVGGSDECLAIVKDGHKAISDLLLTADGRRKLEKDFNICKPFALEDKKAQKMFAGDGVIYIPAQGNDPACASENCNIEKICKTLIGLEGDAYTKLQTYATSNNPACTSTNYDIVTRMMKNETNPERSWLYQTCTEWGFYQTCPEGSGCPYSQGLHTVDYDLQLCEDAFGLSPERVKEEIKYTESVYGGIHLKSPRTLFVNGEVDPWNANSVITSDDPETMPSLWVVGASHHFWTHEFKETDTPEINEARQKIFDQVKAWLKEN